MIKLLQLLFSSLLLGVFDGLIASEEVGQEINSVSTESANFVSVMTGMKPVGWWRLGETSGATAFDSSGRGHTGTYVNLPVLGGAGAIVGDSNGAAMFNATNQQYVEIPDHDDFSLVKAEDAFTRTILPGRSWGFATHGGTWSALVSDGAYYSCDGSVAKLNETSAGATWMQVLSKSMTNVDLQVKASWSASAVGAAIRPITLSARVLDALNYYGAELREDVGGQLTLSLRSTVAGRMATLASVPVGTYSVNGWWYVRFQVDGSELKAKAWSLNSTEPVDWQVTASDSTIKTAGTVGVRSSNSGSTTRPFVAFDDFRTQSVGMTVHAWMRPDVLNYDNTEDYVYWIGKGSLTQFEWAFRMYSKKSCRPNRISAYMWKAIGDLGAGASFQDMLVRGDWIQVVAVFDPGDELDQEAGVSIYRDGVFRTGPTSAGTLYSSADYLVRPSNGTAPLRFASRDFVSFFTGAIDEVAVFDRKLSAAEVSQLFSAARPALSGATHSIDPCS
jgi:hypothetical protein